jgi:DNA-binding phage protein
MMPRRQKFEKMESLLRAVQRETESHRTNAYQIAKATGLPLRSVQNLLRQVQNPTLRNVEVILTAFGLQMYLCKGAAPTIQPSKRAAQRHAP